MFSEALTPGEVWHNLGLVYLKRGEREAAERAYERALEEDPRLSQAREALELLRAQPPHSRSTPAPSAAPASLAPSASPLMTSPSEGRPRKEN